MPKLENRLMKHIDLLVERYPQLRWTGIRHCPRRT